MKKILKWIVLVISFVILINTMYGIYEEGSIKKADTNKALLNNVQNTIQDENNNEEANNIEQSTENSNITENTNKVEEEYMGYAVVANLKIEKLNIDTYVLEDFNQEAMNVCVTKFFGPEPNEIGNFCISGHNYITKNMFGYLYKLKIGDTLTLTDNKNGAVEYEIYDEYRVNATETYRTITKNQWKKRGYIGYML